MRERTIHDYRYVEADSNKDDRGANASMTAMTYLVLVRRFCSRQPYINGDGGLILPRLSEACII